MLYFCELFLHSAVSWRCSTASLATSYAVILPRSFSKLLQLSKFYQVPTLTLVCCDRLRASLTANEAAHILHLAEQLQLEDLKQEALDFIMEHKSIVMDTEGWADLQDQPDRVDQCTTRRPRHPPVATLRDTMCTVAVALTYPLDSTASAGRATAQQSHSKAEPQHSRATASRASQPAELVS